MFSVRTGAQDGASVSVRLVLGLELRLALGLVLELGLAFGLG